MKCARIDSVFEKIRGTNHGLEIIKKSVYKSNFGKSVYRSDRKIPYFASKNNIVIMT